MSRQGGQVGKPTNPQGDSQGTQDVRFRGLQLRQEFHAMRITTPMVFIEWKRGELTDDQKYRIRMALLGRGTPADAPLLDMIKGVLDELKAA